MNSEVDTSSWKHSLEKSEYYKLAKIYIKDLLVAKNVGDNFIFKHMPFVYVQLIGNIISITSHKEKLCLEVHDGTNSIICMVEENFFNKIESYKTKCSQDDDGHIECKKSSALHQATLMTCRATSHLAKCTPSKQDLHPGDIIIIRGKLGEHNNKRYVFVDKINSGTVADLCNSIEYLQYMYKKEYEKL